MDLSWHVVRRFSDSLEVYVLAVPREAIYRQVEAPCGAWRAPDGMAVEGSWAPRLATGELFENTAFLEALANRHGGPVQVPIPALPHPDNLPAAMYSVNLGLAAKKV